MHICLHISVNSMKWNDDIYLRPHLYTYIVAAILIAIQLNNSVGLRVRLMIYYCYYLHANRSKGAYQLEAKAACRLPGQYLQTGCAQPIEETTKNCRQKFAKFLKFYFRTFF